MNFLKKSLFFKLILKYIKKINIRNTETYEKVKSAKNNVKKVTTKYETL